MQRKRKLVSTAAGLLLVLLTTAGVAGAKAAFVVASAPMNQSVKNLVKGTFYETVKCSESCEVTTTVYIRSSLAKQLGFKNVGKDDSFVVGRVTQKIAGGSNKRIALPLSKDARDRLSKVKTGMQLIGNVAAFSTKSSSRSGGASWIVSLRG